MTIKLNPYAILENNQGNIIINAYRNASYNFWKSLLTQTE